MKREELLVTDIDMDRATRAMFEYNMGATAEVLFGDTVRLEEYASVLPGGEREDGGV